MLSFHALNKRKLTTILYIALYIRFGISSLFLTLPAILAGPDTVSIMQENTEQFDEILDQFSTGEKLNDSLKRLQKRGIESMLEGELDHHLGYDKHQGSPTGNLRTRSVLSLI